MFCNVLLFIFLFSRLGERRVAYRALIGKIEGKSHVEDLSIDRSYYRNGLRGNVNCIDVAQDRKNWQDIVNTVI
jgi:hypothetical protein